MLFVTDLMSVIMRTYTDELHTHSLFECGRRIKPLRMRAHCPDCRHSQEFERIEVDHRSCLRASLVSCGIGFFSWALQCLGQVLRPWRCHQCGGHQPEFRPFFRLGEEADA